MYAWMQNMKYRVLHRRALKRMRNTVLFDEAWYREKCGDNISPNEDAAAHYLNGGWHIADPSACFSNKDYLTANPDVWKQPLAPLAHYLLYGKKEHRMMAVGDGQKLLLTDAYHAHRVRRGISRKIGRLCCAGMIEKNSNARILVCVQLFYPRSWDEVEQYLLALEPYRCDFVFTVHSKRMFREQLAQIAQRWPEAKILTTPNTGFDIGSYHYSLKKVDLSQYDIIFKVHTKGTNRAELSMYGQYFRRRDWFLYLFEGVLGSFTVHRTIDRLLHDDKCGLVAAGNLLVHDPRHKEAMLKETFEAMEMNISIPEKYRYVAGTCFACKPGMMREFAEAKLDFAPSKRGFFSLAHCTERSMCFPAQQNGMYMYGTRVCLLRRMLRKLQGVGKMYPARDRLIADERFMLNNEFVYRSIEPKKIMGYELTTLRLGDIRRRWFDGRVHSLKWCAPYRYLMGDVKAYERYSRYHLARNLFPMTRERFDELIRSMEQNGYDERYILVVDRDNVIVDGQHRACCLLKLYGEDHRVKVLRVFIKCSWRKATASMIRRRLPKHIATPLIALGHKLFPEKDEKK